MNNMTLLEEKTMKKRKFDIDSPIFSQQNKKKKLSNVDKKRGVEYYIKTLTSLFKLIATEKNLNPVKEYVLCNKSLELIISIDGKMDKGILSMDTNDYKFYYCLKLDDRIKKREVTPDIRGEFKPLNCVEIERIYWESKNNQQKCNNLHLKFKFLDKDDSADFVTSNIFNFPSDPDFVNNTDFLEYYKECQSTTDIDKKKYHFYIFVEYTDSERKKHSTAIVELNLYNRSDSEVFQTLYDKQFPESINSNAILDYYLNSKNDSSETIENKDDLFLCDKSAVVQSPGELLNFDSNDVPYPHDNVDLSEFLISSNDTLIEGNQTNLSSFSTLMGTSAESVMTSSMASQYSSSTDLLIGTSMTMNDITSIPTPPLMSYDSSLFNPNPLYPDSSMYPLAPGMVPYDLTPGESPINNITTNPFAPDITTSVTPIPSVTTVTPIPSVSSITTVPSITTITPVPSINPISSIPSMHVNGYHLNNSTTIINNTNFIYNAQPPIQSPQSISSPNLKTPVNLPKIDISSITINDTVIQSSKISHGGNPKELVLDEQSSKSLFLVINSINSIDVHRDHPSSNEIFISYYYITIKNGKKFSENNANSNDEGETTDSVDRIKRVFEEGSKGNFVHSSPYIIGECTTILYNSKLGRNNTFYFFVISRGTEILFISELVNIKTYRRSQKKKN